jgi:monoterpene epsilon-lactone hydrolase
MGECEIDAIRDLLTGKARPVGWAERRKRIEEVCAVWPVAGDVASRRSMSMGVVTFQDPLMPSHR